MSVSREPVSAGRSSPDEHGVSAREEAPLRPDGGASFLAVLAVDEVALEGEVIVQAGVVGGELLK
jgi:hypothetical protein